jgi:hypothetical protein
VADGKTTRFEEIRGLTALGAVDGAGDVATAL